MYVCPGCQQHFQPGGYANHLRLSHDLRCRSVRNSVLRMPPDLIRPPSPPPAPGSPPTLESLDIEMVDVSDEPNSPAGHTLDPPPPGQTTSSANELDRQEGAQLGPEPHPNEFPTMGPRRPSHSTVIIDSDVESDAESDDDGCDHPSHRNQHTSRPGLVDSENSDQAAAVQTARTFAKLFNTVLVLTGNTR